MLAVLAETHLPPSRLEIEITESTLLDRSHMAEAGLKILREAGVKVALDDFGTGYSSLSYLLNLDVDRIKIDKSFVHHLGESQSSLSIIQAIVTMARAVGVAVTAEGVETNEQRELLTLIGCDHLQGYLLSHPLTARALGEHLAESPDGTDGHRSCVRSNRAPPRSIICVVAQSCMSAAVFLLRSPLTAASLINCSRWDVMSRLHAHPESHLVERIGWLRAAVLGANDGIVSTASLIVGVASASAKPSDIVIAGVAGLVAGAMSMAAGEYVSVSSQSDTEQADLARERKELSENVEFEHEELAQIYVARGVDHELARKVADQLMAKDALGRARA